MLQNLTNRRIVSCMKQKMRAVNSNKFQLISNDDLIYDIDLIIVVLNN